MGVWLIYLQCFKGWRALTSSEAPAILDLDWTYAVPNDWVRPKTNAELHAEIAALRAEIAELKRHLSPPVE